MRIKMTESRLEGLIAETVNRIMESGEYIGMDPSVFDRKEELKDLMGADELLDAITGKMEERRLDEILSEIEAEINQGMEDSKDEPDFDRPEEL